VKSVSKCFLSETTWTIETKLPRNDDWKILYRFYVIYTDWKSKMAATAGHRLTLGSMGKWSRPSWMSDRHKTAKFCRGPSYDNSWAVWFHLSKWFQRGSVLRHFSHRVQC
jgi:hypothetical protein